LFDRDAEAVGDGDEGVAAAKGVALLAAGRADAFDGNDELIAGFDGLCGGDLIELGNLRGAGVE
jgi:hypothetical protein